MFEKNALGGNARVSKIQYSNTTLKVIAAVMTAIGTFGVAILERVMKLDNYSTETLLEAMESGKGNVMLMSSLILLCIGISSMALPIYAKILIEGFKHSADIKKYAVRIFLLAVISEIPYDLAMRGNWIDWNEQNPLFGMLFALVMLYFLAYFEHITKFKGFLLKAMIVIASVLWAMFLGVSYGAYILIIVTAVLWLLDGNGALTTFCGVAASVLNFPAPFGFIFSHFYNGEKGKLKRVIFYVVYPAHMLLLGVIGKYLM